jgi:hypothetical protein
MKLKCSNCAYEREVAESDTFDSMACIICGGVMVFAETYDYLKKAEKEEKKTIQNETEGMNEQIDEIMVKTIYKDIEVQGEARTWDIINSVPIERRLEYVECFIEAKRRIKSV